MRENTDMNQKYIYSCEFTDSFGIFKSISVVNILTIRHTMFPEHIICHKQKTLQLESFLM